MFPPTIAPLGTPAGRLTATRVAAIIQSLLLYDEIWTAEVTTAAAVAAAGEPLPPEDVAAIRDLVAEMKRELDNLNGPLYELRSMIEEAEPGTLETALDNLVSSGVVSESVAEQLRSGLQADLQAAFVDAANYIVENASNEAQALDEQLAALERGEPGYGDFGNRFWCAAIVASGGAAIAATVLTGGAAAPVGLAIGSMVASSAAGLHYARCFEGFPRFRFGHGH